MESKHNTIKYQDISGVGLVFVRKEDPVNLFSLQITKQLYSLIGFYYESKSSGKKRIHIVLSDICGIVSSQWMNKFTIENLIHDPLVTRLSIRKMCSVLDKNGLEDKELTKKRDSDFKAAIAEVTSEGPVSSTEDWIKQMFGYEIGQPNKGSTTVELVNKVIMATGNWDKIKEASHSSYTSVEGLIENKTPSVIPKNSEGKNYIISKLGSKMKQVQVYQAGVSNMMMQSYLVENGLFDPIKHLDLPKKNPLEVNLRREQSITESKKFLIEAVSTFVSMLMENKKFFNTVVDGINNNAMLKNKQKSDEFKASLLNIIQTSNNVVGTMVSMIEKGKFSFELLKHKIDRYNLRLNEVTGTVGLKSDLVPRLDQQYCNRVIVIENDHYQNKFHRDLKVLHHTLRSAVESIVDHNTPIININEMIESVNDIIGCSNSILEPVRLIRTKKSYGCVLSTQKGKSIPIQLKDGTRLALPTVGYDLNIYGCEHLKELLEALDVMTDGDDAFDDLRSSIADKYSKCDDNECKYH